MFKRSTLCRALGRALAPVAAFVLAATIALAVPAAPAAPGRAKTRGETRDASAATTATTASDNATTATAGPRKGSGRRYGSPRSLRPAPSGGAIGSAGPNPMPGTSAPDAVPDPASLD